MKAKKTLALILTFALAISLFPAAYAAEADPLSFADAKVTELNITLDGKAATVKMYEDVYCAAPNRTEDQKVAVYVPENAGKASPIIFMVNNAGWMQNNYAGRKGVADGAAYTSDSNTDVIGKALAEGYVIVSYGCRSRGNGANENGEYLGHSPATMVDTKAVIRYLKYNEEILPAGNPERIVITGTSGGGALSVVIAASGDSEDYFKYLNEIGAAGISCVDGNYTSTISDSVWATIAYCPITDLGNACAAYEWTYNSVRERMYNEGLMSYDGVDKEVVMDSSAELKAMFEEYVDALDLKRDDGSELTSANLQDTIIALVIKEIEESLEEIGKDQMLADLGYGRAPIEIPEFTEEELAALEEQLKGVGMTLEQYFAYKGWVEPYDMMASDWNDWFFIDENGKIEIDFDEYLYFVARNETLKISSAFSNMGLNYVGQRNEDNLFGDINTEYSPFNEYAWNNDASENGVGYDETGLTWDEYLASAEGEYLSKQIKMTSPIQYLMDTEDGKSAPYWYVRYGMKDRDSSFAIETILYHAALNDSSIEDLNFEFAWLKPHAGDYDVQEAYAWLKSLLPVEFTDVADNAWYAADVQNIVASGLMKGVSDTQFAPEQTVTRAMLATILYRHAGSPAVDKAPTFKDVEAGQWYADAITWAAEEGIVLGYSEDIFGTNDAVTREQFVTMLYRYYGEKAVEGVKLDQFTDAAAVSAWAVDAIEWAVAEGIIVGNPDGTVNPKGTATRAEAAVMLGRV